MEEQTDTILRFPNLCGDRERDACDSPFSNMNVALENDDKDGSMHTTQEPLCSTMVPVGCPRILCKDSELGYYTSCRMSLFAEGQLNESGYWIRLPCGTCTEKKDLHPTTEGYKHE